MSSKVPIGESLIIIIRCKVIDDESRLMELTPELLQEIESGNDLVIRGDEDDSVVVCTENATYDLKMCTTRYYNKLFSQFNY